MNRKLLLLLALLLFSYGLLHVRLMITVRPEGEQTIHRNCLPKRYNPDQSFTAKY